MSDAAASKGGPKADAKSVAQADGEKVSQRQLKKAAKAEKLAKAKAEKKQAASVGATIEKPRREKKQQQKPKQDAKEGKQEEKKKPKAPVKPLKPMSEWPRHIQRRTSLWDKLYAEQEVKKIPGAKIRVTLPDGRQMEGVAGVTTPLAIAKLISRSLADRVVVAKVDGVVTDAWRPVEKDCTLELCDFESPEGKYTFWHSSAHVLGQAIELEFADAKLTIGPPIDDGGFYYDVFMDDRKIVPEDYAAIEGTMRGVVADKQAFQRLELTKEQALDMFGDNKFKVDIITNKIPDGALVTAYRCGPLIDLCRGPHVANTASLKAVAVTKHSGSYWMSDATQPALQRIYGISFPDEKQLDEYQEFIRQAEENDHRRIGLQQKLFFFHPVSPGSCFFLPHGARIYNKLCNFIRDQYRRRGFEEVLSPNLFLTDLWKTSGHYENYKENMFIFETKEESTRAVDRQEFGLKPMNCPGHCIMFKHELHSYRDLPIRMADFGVLHRNEISGALSGLTRVRRFQQDDAHIFCREDQIEVEVAGALDFLHHVYKVFGFEFKLTLSTRPEKFLGEPAVWDRAEKALEQCLDNFGHSWVLNPGDGAFYGPKIDIQVFDALKRRHQCATIQLDFQLPIRFDLSYKTETGEFARPVIIHRAVLGSVERMMAILIEHLGGRWPFWLSPRQVIVLPISDKHLEYARDVRKQLHDLGFYADVDEQDGTVKKKVAEARSEMYNYWIVVGDREAAEKTITVGARGQSDRGEKSMTMDDFVAMCRQHIGDFK